MELEELDFVVDIETPLYLTEEEGRVLSCLGNVFPEAEFKVQEEKIKGETTDLERFKEILRDRKIRDTALSYMRNQVRDNKCTFVLSKQATCGMKINFSEEDQPLGGVRVTIESDEIMEVIESVTEKESSE